MLQPCDPQPPQPSCNPCATSRNHRATIYSEPRNHRNCPLRGSVLVAPPRAHPRTPGQTPSRLRLRAFRPGHRLMAGHELDHTPDRQTQRRTDHAGSFLEGQHCPRHRHACVDIQRKHFPPSAADRTPDQQRESASAFSCLPAIGVHRTARRIHGLPTGYAPGLIIPCASRPSGKPACPPHNPLRYNETPRRRHLSDDQKAIYARALSRPLTLLDRVRRARGPGDEPLAKRGLRRGFIPTAGRKTRGIRGWQGKVRPPAIIDLNLQHSAALCEIFGRPRFKKVGFPARSASRFWRGPALKKLGLS